ncbi:VCBS repeat-containing protein [Yeosuana sp. MJ-SS3]|uniref:VCBS repeat-containing protein n=1 Tax=Gilvirhabdus luticola TaxID=3079858 RepID=A0ABU3U3X4_9FLAO|nr:VCBS repeat-containing protein [Yeosuana sp. MJ-SS3]MDU8885051.1 VCBS repeat-containing protein [Yeosuana sp. MJ-SS3]
MRKIIILSVLLTSVFSCVNDKNENSKISDNPLYTKLDNTETGIDFINKVENEKDFNIFNYRNFYNGGGVAIGDINNDGLPDVYLTANRTKNKLYLNKGDFKFEDISQISNTSGNRSWSTGVVMVDINADGWLDIYVCNAGNVQGDDQKNELFINNKDLTFTESAEEYNLADSGFTTHTAFFDYDGDGDLDAYILNNSFIPVSSLGYVNKRDLRSEEWDLPEVFKGGGDKLMRNDGGVFVDVSKKAGIYGSLIGFGLGVTIGDVNNDMLLDIYVSNDFYEHDYLYINNGDGTFKEDIKNRMSHLSMSSMGADMADINNDGRPEIFVTDMLPENDERLKNTSDFERFDVYQLKKNNDFYNQYMQNTLQLNNGDESFSEVAFFSGIAKTDWSWGALIFDMDNDGYKDIYVCNGIYHDLTNQDFTDFFANEVYQGMAISGVKTSQDSIINSMPSNAVTNYAYKNNHDLTFENETHNWGFDEPSFSNGAAYGDLDNDGDLDLVVNNLNMPLFVYKNNSVNNYLKVNLIGQAPNTFAIGSVVEVFTNNQIIRQELIPTRGFQSSIDYVLTFGLGNSVKADSIKVIWPNTKVHHIGQTNANQQLTLSIEKAKENFKLNPIKKPVNYFDEIQQNLITHNEDTYIDFNYEGLIPKMLSKEGPALAVGDVNNDGNEDVYIGGAYNQKGQLYLLDKEGVLKPSSFRTDAVFEDTCAVFVDIDGDGDKDLLVGSGGNFKNARTGVRAYINDGKGIFGDYKIIARTNTNISTIAPNDFDNDGDIDLFVGSLSVVGTYGVDPENVFLENDGNGNFNDITMTKASQIKSIGMTTAAVWQDIDEDGKEDLIIVGEWMSPKIFKNDGTSLKELDSNLKDYSGMYNTVEASDFDNDGDVDLVFGNRGLNSIYQADKEHPAKMFVNDFDSNGTIEQIFTQTLDGRDVPIHLKRELTGQIVSLKKQNLKFSEYATKSIDELFASEVMAASTVKQVTTFSSYVAYNNGHGNFTVQELPSVAQLSCICSIKCIDINKDGVPDLILGGNNFSFKPQFSRLDANQGLVLFGNDKGEFINQTQTGFKVKGEVKAMEWFTNESGKRYLIVGINDEQPKIFSIND